MSGNYVEFFELVLTPCTRTYGVAPCTAALGVTDAGTGKCYNSPGTCQSRQNYLAGTQVVRWVNGMAAVPQAIAAIPSMTGLSTRSQEIKPGESLPVRESVTANFVNHPHSDVGFDKYLADRSFNPYNQGTFWRKFMARWPAANLKGLECRTVRGTDDQALDEMERRYYVLDSTSGPAANGTFSITAKDAIKFLDDDKAVAPEVSPGALLADINSTATSLTLNPAGIGNLAYPVSGYASIGDEAVSFTRVNDVVTLTARAIDNSKLGDHKAGDTFQLALDFNGVEVSSIINTLLLYTKIPTDYFDYTRWSTETVANLGKIFTRKIYKPTGVKTLINELIQQAGLVIWTDTQAKKIRIKVIKSEPQNVTYTDNDFIEGSLNTSVDYDKHITNVLFYYGAKNYIKKTDEKENYNVILNRFELQTDDLLADAPLSQREIFSHWVLTSNSSAAKYAADLLLKRYSQPPRTASFKLPSRLKPIEGSVVKIQTRLFEDANGAVAKPITFFIKRVEPNIDGYSVAAEEFLLPQSTPAGMRLVYISSSTTKINLKALHDSIYVPAVSGSSVKFIIEQEVLIGSDDQAIPAIYNPTWPAGVSVFLEFLGSGASHARVQGCPGSGGYAWSGDMTGGGHAPSPGGLAFKTDSPITLINPYIWGGGGGGAQGSVPPYKGASTYGGNGAGYPPAAGATATTGGPGGVTGAYGSGTGVPGGAGGGPGLPGASVTFSGGGSVNPGAAAGKAIQGFSLCTISGTSDIRGATSG